MAFRLFSLALCAALALAAEWSVVFPNVATIDMGVSFISETTGYTAGTLNGFGPAVLKTVDGGITFSRCNVTNWGSALLLLGIDAVSESVVVSAVAGEVYSVDNGESFHVSIGGGIAQCVRHLGDGNQGQDFAAVGEFPLRNTNGVAVSFNGGRTFAAYDAELYTGARYGAFPTADTWYISAGSWPVPPPPPMAPMVAGKVKRTAQATNVDRALSSLQRRFPTLARKSQVLSATGEVVYRPAAFNKDPVGTASDAAPYYTGQITKSVNGGDSFFTVFAATNGTFYFNGIDCAPNNADHCCAVGEGFSSSVNPSREPGARIHCTTDGGRTWERTFWEPETDSEASSLMDIRFATATEVWAVGGKITFTQFPLILHSTDGGQTWSSEVLEASIGALAVSVSFPTPSVGYGVILNGITQSSSIIKYQ